ncbi:MAG: glycosyltransferase [Candidatus Dadabacteria bacterium]|nr:MAG: glycosyltransferase [Candidatus Dadabacteria bacterium]
MPVVMLPAYNEEQDLPELLKALFEKQSGFLTPLQVVLVDDGSSDSTIEVAEAFKDHLQLEILKHPVNQGLGAALNTGIKHILKNYQGIMVIMDSDNTHDPCHIPELEKAIQSGYDLAIASRFVKGAQVIGVPFYRRILSNGASWLLRLSFPYKGVKDYSSGFRAYSIKRLKDALKSRGLDEFKLSRGFESMLELLLILRAAGLNATEVPLVLRYDLKQGESKMPVFTTVFRYLKLIARGKAFGR